MIRPHGNQPTHFLFGYVEINKAQAKTYIFGAHKKTCNISLSVKSSEFHGEECCNNIALAANIWPQLKSNDPMIFDCNKLHNMRAMWYGDTDCNGRPEEIPKYECSYNGSYSASQCGCGGSSCGKKKKKGCGKKSGCGCGGHGGHGGNVRIIVEDAENETNEQCCPQPDADVGDVRFIWTHNQIIPSSPIPFYFVKMENDGFVNFQMVGNHVLAPVNHKLHLFHFYQTDDAGSAALEFHSHSNSFENLNPLINPPWLLTNLQLLNIPKNSTTREGLEVGQNTGPGSLTQTDLETNMV